MKHITLSNLEKGKIGEEFAQSLYQKAGFDILETDLRIGRAQVDLVARRKDLICFVEVKYRRTMHEAHHAIKVAQLNRIARCADHYMQERPQNWQIDALLIDRNMNWQRIDNIPHAMHIWRRK